MSNRFTTFLLEPSDRFRLTPSQIEPSDRFRLTPSQVEPSDRFRLTPSQVEPSDRFRLTPSQIEPSDRFRLTPSQIEPSDRFRFTKRKTPLRGVFLLCFFIVFIPFSGILAVLCTPVLEFSVSSSKPFKFLIMALIKLTAIVDNISGKLNGTVFARNKGGHYMRSKSKPTNPRTFLQSARRAIFGAVAQSWRSLSQAQRNAWDAATADFKYQNRLGDSKTLSGFSLYQQLNSNLVLITQPIISAPPIPQQMLSPASASATIESSPDKMVVKAVFVGNDTAPSKVALFVTPHLSPGVKNASNRYRFLGSYTTSAISDPAGLEITTQYSARFGFPPAGSKVAFRIVSISAVSGEASAPLDFAAEVVLGP